MRSVIFFAAASMVFLGACKLDDGADISTDDFLAGTWSLVNVSGGIAGVDDDFEEGVITWTFNAVNRTVTVENNNATPVLMDILPSGTYPFAIVDGEDSEELIVNEINLGNILCVDFGLVHVDQGEQVSDGVAITFTR